MKFVSAHELDFEVADWYTPQFKQFRIGTCIGLWSSTDDTYDILAVKNYKKGNGHFEDVMQWFEMSCQRDKKGLRILEVWNKRFKRHLIEKRGFEDIGNDNLIKRFK